MKRVYVDSLLSIDLSITAKAKHKSQVNLEHEAEESPSQRSEFQHSTLPAFPVGYNTSTRLWNR